jgi:fermentation-respiration switch protein FrsA (DUF1100 family)
MKMKVKFKSNGVDLAGHLYLPKDMKEGEKRPAIVIDGPTGIIKQAAAGIYARKMSERGFISLGFGHTRLGESEEIPNNEENPFAKSHNIKNAITFLTAHDQVEEGKIGAIGICEEGGFKFENDGYVAYTAATDRRIKAVGLVSSWPDRQPAIHPMEGGHEEFESVNPARIAYRAGEEPKYVSFLAGAEDAASVCHEGREYFFTSRKEHSAWADINLSLVVDQMVSYSPFAIIDMISPNPLLIIVGDNSKVKGKAELMYEKAQEPKDLVVIDQLRDLGACPHEHYIGQAIDKLEEFFKENL